MDRWVQDPLWFDPLQDIPGIKINIEMRDQYYEKGTRIYDIINGVILEEILKTGDKSPPWDGPVWWYPISEGPENGS